MNGADWLREQARECHRLAVARGKYDGASLYKIYSHTVGEGREWFDEAFRANSGREGAKEREAEEIGDNLAIWLSIAQHRGIDPAKALADAQERNRRRVGEADQSGFCRSCGRPITDDGAYIKCFPCRVKDQGEGE